MIDRAGLVFDGSLGVCLCGRDVYERVCVVGRGLEQKHEN